MLVGKKSGSRNDSVVIVVDEDTADDGGAADDNVPEDDIDKTVDGDQDPKLNGGGQDE